MAQLWKKNSVGVPIRVHILVLVVEVDFQILVVEILQVLRFHQLRYDLLLVVWACREQGVKMREA